MMGAYQTWTKQNLLTRTHFEPTPASYIRVTLSCAIEQSTLCKPRRLTHVKRPTTDSSTIGIALPILRYLHCSLYDITTSKPDVPDSCIDIQVIYCTGVVAFCSETCMALRR
ncbi:hypothetical protein BDR07DRAFT_102965 [Suillus spraguei]|nr:hypothetical protein BDR07DRAFT_102965 [Suillus spraguei]